MSTEVHTTTAESLEPTSAGGGMKRGVALIAALVMVLGGVGAFIGVSSASAAPRHPAPCYVNWPSSTSKTPANNAITCGSSYTTSNRKVISRRPNVVHLKYKNRDVYCGRNWQRLYGVHCGYGA